MNEGLPPADRFNSPWRDPLDALWRVFRTPLTARLLLLSLAVAVVLGYFIPQLPAGVAADPAALASWAADHSPVFRSNLSWLRAIGLTHVYSSWWFRFLLSLCSLGLLIILTDQILGVKRFLLGGVSPTVIYAHPPRSRELPQSDLSATVELIRQELLTRRYLVKTDTSSNEIILRSQRWPASLLAHLGALVVLAGLFLNSTFGESVSDLPLLPGEHLPLPFPRGGYSALLIPTALSQPTDMDSQVDVIELHRGEAPLIAGSVGAGQTLSKGSLSLSLQERGFLLHIKGWTRDGQPTQLEAYPRREDPSHFLNLIYAPNQSERYFRSLDSGQAYQITLVGDRLRIDIYRQGETSPALRQEIARDGSIALDGEVIQFEAGHYVLTTLRYDPAWLMMLGGGLLALAGLGLSIMCRPSILIWQFRPSSQGLQLVIRGNDAYPHLGWRALRRLDTTGDMEESDDS